MSFWLEPELVEQVPTLSDFEGVLGIQGELFRNLPDRQTLQVKVEGRSFFIKRHLGVGWQEIFKNLFQLRLPVISARNELNAIRRLEALGVETLHCLGFGESGSSPASRKSFIITEDLVGSVSLEDYCADWLDEPATPARWRLKRRLLNRLAGIARQLHDNGVNHRDFYICHFHVWPDRLVNVDNIKIVLIDLHRVQIRRKLPRRWRLKDIAGLYFSAMDAGLTQRDCLRFISEYRSTPWVDELGSQSLFWRDVEREARRLYYKAHGRYPGHGWPRLQQ